MEGNYYVYVIECFEGRKYIGLTFDLRKRLGEHNAGKSRWTKSFTEWKIIFTRKFDCYSEARKFEIFLKKQKGGDKFKEIIAGWSNGSSGGS